MVELFKILLDGREEECKRYWTIFSLMSIINGGLLAAFFVLTGSRPNRIILSLLGIALCILWLFAQARIRGWIGWWEDRIEELEPNFIEGIHFQQVQNNLPGVPPNFKIFINRKGAVRVGISTRIIGWILASVFAVAWSLLLAINPKEVHPVASQRKYCAYVHCVDCEALRGSSMIYPKQNTSKRSIRCSKARAARSATVCR